MKWTLVTAAVLTPSAHNQANVRRKKTDHTVRSSGGSRRRMSDQNTDSRREQETLDAVCGSRGWLCASECVISHTGILSAWSVDIFQRQQTDGERRTTANAEYIISFYDNKYFILFLFHCWLQQTFPIHIFECHGESGNGKAEKTGYKLPSIPQSRVAETYRRSE